MKMIGKLQLTASTRIVSMKGHGMVWYGILEVLQKFSFKKSKIFLKNFTHSCAPPIQQNKFCFNLIWT